MQHSKQTTHKRPTSSSRPQRSHRSSRPRPSRSREGEKPSGKKNVIGIIPARMGSKRFPGKPLAEIAGKAMIYHVYHRAKMSRTLTKLYIATPDQKIREYCLKNGMNVVFTKDTHKRASDRTSEAVSKIERKTKQKIDIVTMIQGDEPMITKEMIDLAVKPLVRDPKVLVSNLVTPLKSKNEFHDPNEVKVVANKDGFALYFSREPIPSPKLFHKPVTLLKQVCIIPFQRDFLSKFQRLTPTPLEQIESIDMLRCLEHGIPVKLVYSKFPTYSVDTKEDLAKVEKLMRHDKLIKQYKPGP